MNMRRSYHEGRGERVKPKVQTVVLGGLLYFIECESDELDPAGWEDQASRKFGLTTRGAIVGAPIGRSGRYSHRATPGVTIRSARKLGYGQSTKSATH